MIIPKEHLDKVEYYDVKYNKSWFGLGRRQTVVTLHYKGTPWPDHLPKKFKFAWLLATNDYWEEPQAARILQDYLIKYFGK